MNHESLLPTKVRRLVDDLLNGVLTKDDLLQLDQYLDGDVDLQQQFRNYCQLHLNLETETRSQRALDLAVCQICESTVERCDVMNCELAEPVSRRAGELSWKTWAGLAGCMLLAATVASLVVSQPGNPEQQPQARGGEDSGGLDVITVRLATAESRTLPIGEFGTVSIQGPAYFELYGTKGALLKYGRIKVRIDDERGRGFAVETPQGLVTDLGTEFGVDVADDANTGVVVFEGAVDLSVPSAADRDVIRVERLIQGEGLSVQTAGRLDRIMSIVTGNVTTFQQQGERQVGAREALIVDVSDNIRSVGFRNFYEIVPAGLREDALCYADRPAHDWNGVDESGLPGYLVGADYVKPFNNDKMRGDVEISVALVQPARLFVFFDDRVPAPHWLREEFHNTGDKLGMDVGRYVLDGVPYHKADRAEGAGVSIDAIFSIWERTVEQPGVVQLGPNAGGSVLTAMYGIAAVPLETTKSEN